MVALTSVSLLERDHRDILLSGRADSIGLWLDHDHERKRLTWR